MIKPQFEETAYRACPGCGCWKYKIKYVEQQYFIVKCENCTLVYLANPPTKNRLYDDYYNTTPFKSSDYRKNSSSIPLSLLFETNKQRLTVIKKECSTGQLLDIGCGLGFFMKSALNDGFDVKGIDISPRAVKYARTSFNLDVGTISLEELLMQSKKYDIITLWHALEHFLNPAEELNKIFSLLKNGGYCFIEVPNLHSFKFMISRHKWIGGNHPHYHRTFFTSATLERLLKKSGFAHLKRLRPLYPDISRGSLYHAAKKILNRLAIDSFLTYFTRKKS